MALMELKKKDESLEEVIFFFFLREHLVMEVSFYLGILAA